MSIKFFCTCGKKLKVGDETAGKKIACPECGSPISVPLTSTADGGSSKPKDEQHSSSAGDKAGDLMKQTVAAEKARRHGEGGDHHHHHEKKPGFGAGEVAVYSLTKAVPLVVGTVVIVAGVFWLSSQVWSGKAKTPPLAPVSGMVTLDGKPLAGAIITFRPMEGPQDKPGSKGAASIGRTDGSGKYTLNYVADIPGAVLGKHQVDIQAQDAEGREVIPAKYRFTEPLLRDVQPDKNDINFDLTSTP